MSALSLDPWLLNPYTEFLRSLEQNRLPGSVVVSCPEGLGGDRLVAAMAEIYLCQRLNAQGACGVCQSCLSFWQNNHPDFIRVRATDAQEAKDGADITKVPFDKDEREVAQRYVRISSLRQMQTMLSESSALGYRKVAIISDAQLMQESAANAVLKTFEEPPANTLIIMQTTSLDALLPTILSRAFKIRACAPDVAEGLRFLKEHRPDLGDDILSLALSLTANAPYGALKLLSSTFKVGRDEQNAILIIKDAMDSFAQCLGGRCSVETTIAKFKVIPNIVIAQILGEFILETLKYKAGINPNSLALLKNFPLDVVGRLPAVHLFKARDDLKYIAAQAPMLQPRAPFALLRAWLDALTKK